VVSEIVLPCVLIGIDPVLITSIAYPVLIKRHHSVLISLEHKAWFDPSRPNAHVIGISSAAKRPRSVDISKVQISVIVKILSTVPIIHQHSIHIIGVEVDSF
jgi:hypothetical protein